MSSTTSSQSTAGGVSSSPHQDRLITFCRQQGARTPNFQIVSDRRGGRTAWSCVVTVQGTPISARFWYDGQYVNNAREDAAERALQMLGVLPPPSSQPPIHLRLSSQQYHGMINS